MKHTLLLLLAFVSVFTFNSCSDDGPEDYIIPITISNFTVNALGAPQQWHSFTNQQITSNIESQLNAFGYSLTNVKKIVPKDVQLTITSGANFNTIEFVDAYVKTNATDSIKVAYNVDIPSGVSTLPLISEFNDITPILTQPSFTFYVRAFNTGAFGPVDGTATFTVEVTVEK